MIESVVQCMLRRLHWTLVQGLSDEELNGNSHKAIEAVEQWRDRIFDSFKGGSEAIAKEMIALSLTITEEERKHNVSA